MSEAGMEEPVWRRLPMRAMGPMAWTVLRTHWGWILGGTAGGGWQLKNAMPGDWGPWVLPVLFVVLVTVITILRWRNLRFYMTLQALHLRRGGISREEIVLEFARVQGLQVHQSLLQRVFGLYDVALETSGSEADAAHLPAASAALLAELRQHLHRDAGHAASPHLTAASIRLAGSALPEHGNFELAGNAPRHAAGTASATAGMAHAAHAGEAGSESAAAGAAGTPDSFRMTGAPGAAPAQALAPLEHRLDVRELMAMALTSVQTLAIGPLLFGLVSRTHDQFLRKQVWVPVDHFLTTHVSWWREEWSMLFMVLLAIAGSAVLAVVWGSWRYGAYRLQVKRHEWHHQSGLITPYAQTLNPLRACGVVWCQNFLQAPFGRGWMRVAMIGDSGAKRSSEHQLEGVSRAFRVPWLSYRKVLRLQQQLFASQSNVLLKQARYQHLAPAYLWRNRLQYLWLPLLLAAGGWLLVFGGGSLGMRSMLGMLLWLGLGEWSLRRRFRSWRFAIATHSLRLQRGAFRRQRILLPWSAVQSVCLKQSPLDRLFRVARLELVVPFGRLALPCLSLADAQTLFDFAAAQAIVPLARRY